MEQPKNPIEERSGVRFARLARLVFWESILALRSGGVQVALAVFSLLLLVAIVLGVVRTQQRQANARLTELENGLVKEHFQNALEGKSAPAPSDDANSAQHERFSRLKKQLRMSAKSPYLVSHSTNLWDASLLASPLSALSVGASQSWPDRYRVQGISFAKTVQRNDQVRPVASVYGPFDVAFVIMAIAPLIIIGLTFNVSSRDRETGLQNITVSQTRRLGQVMALRCFVRASLVIGLMVLNVNGVLLIAFGNQFDFRVVANLIAWNIVAMLYILFWAALSHFVNSFGKSSASNGAALLLLWLLLVMIVPGFISHLVQESVPTLPESQLVEIEKSAFEQASENSEELVASFQSQHPDIEIDTEDEQQMALVNYLLAHNAVGEEAADKVTAHYSENLVRARYLNVCNWVSPAISFRNQSDQCSGNSEQAFIAFSSNAADVQARVLKLFLVPSIANEQCSAETVTGLPSFQESDIPKYFSVTGSLESIASVLVWLFVLTGLGSRKYRTGVGNTLQNQSPQKSGVESA